MLRKHRIDFQPVRSRYQEHKARPRALNPMAYAKRHALQKARQAIMPRRGINKNCLVLGADTIVVHRGKILGKPRDIAHAKAMLRRLSGKTHRVITALALWHPLSNRCCATHAVSRVTFRRLDTQDIDRYVRHVHALDKAGAYAIQEGPRIVQSLSGSRSNVIGLPMELLRDMLRRTKAW